MVSVCARDLYWCPLIGSSLLYIYIYIYIYIYLSRQSPWPHSMISIGWWYSEPISEAIGSLVYVPIGLRVLHYPHRLICQYLCCLTPLLPFLLLPNYHGVKTLFFHHLLVTRFPIQYNASRNRSKIGLVPMYRETVSCRLEMYVSISSNPNPSSPPPTGDTTMSHRIVVLVAPP